MEKNTDFSPYDLDSGFADMYKDPMMNPMFQYEQAYMYYRYLTQQMDYKIKCKEYEKEMQYMIANAKKNETNGLNVRKVTDLIVRIDSMDNPKSSYTVGKDAFVAKLVSKLPQDWLNSIIRYGIKAKVSSLK